MCKENDGEMESCQDCGISICFDANSSDDFERPAYVTESGDLFCDIHGHKHDREDEEAEDDEMYLGDFA
jgi:hypothetical protein